MKKQGENCFIQWRIQGRDQGPDPPALDQTEVRRAEKTFFGDRSSPLSKVPGWPPPHPLSQGLEKSGSEPFLPWFNQEICVF